MIRHLDRFAGQIQTPHVDSRARRGTLLSMTEPANVIDKRLANALYRDASINSATGHILGASGKLGVKAVEKLVGGLWVGGNAYLTTEAVEFRANALNKLVHTPGSIEPILFPLSDIESVAYREATITHIVDLSSHGRTLSIRGYNMRAFHAAISKAVDAARKASP